MYYRGITYWLHVTVTNYGKKGQMNYTYVKLGLLFGRSLLKMLMSDPPSPAGNPWMSLIKLFLAGNTSALGGFNLPDRKTHA
jgi:hypothetical protein